MGNQTFYTKSKISVKVASLVVIKQYACLPSFAVELWRNVQNGVAQSKNGSDNFLVQSSFSAWLPALNGSAGKAQRLDRSLSAGNPLCIVQSALRAEAVALLF